MSQNRNAPAYQEYAASMLADLRFRLLPLEARGLLYTMRMECWINRALPASPSDLAFVLGIPELEVTALLPGIMCFFISEEGFIRCPELDGYRAHLESRKLRQSEGGRAGAALTNQKKDGKKPRSGSSTGNPTSNPTSNPQGTRRGASGSLVQSSSVQNSKTKDSNQLVDLSTPAWSDDEVPGENF